MSRALASFEPIDALTAATRVEMFRLFDTYYRGVSEQEFLADLGDKDMVLVIRRADTGAIAGFSTILQQDITTREGSFATVVFSGDTVMDRSFWGAKILQWEFVRYLLGLKVADPRRRLYWMLMSKGFKTYLMVRRNCPRTFPSRNLVDDENLRFVRDEFYAKRFGSAFERTTGLVRFAALRGAVAPEFAHPSPEAALDPDVAFFLAHNPDYAMGTELACVAEVRLRDFPVALAKYVGKVASRTISGTLGIRRPG